MVVFGSGALSVVVVVLLSLTGAEADGKLQYAVRRCVKALTPAWGACSETCGGQGVQKREVLMGAFMKCIGMPMNTSCMKPIVESQPCNRLCYHGGRVVNDSCVCSGRMWGKCCENCK